MKRIATRRASSCAEFQSLEDRRMLAAFGNPWPEPRDLTISFPADGVQLSHYDNDINQALDEIAARQDWQKLVLRAYQTWAIHADLNIGLRNDFNTDFGVPGKIVGDPRFGEFRIGAFPSEGLVASSVPFQAIAGTYSGDLVINSADPYVFHDWENTLPPDPASIDPNSRDLFSVLLHESGNTLGLDDNLLEWSVMFRTYNTPKGLLTPEDVQAIQTLYGARSDPYELLDNGHLRQADLIETPIGFDPNTEVIRTRGSLAHAGDVDHYKITPVRGQQQVQIRIRAEGVSLLKSRLDVVDAMGQPIERAASVSVFDNDVVVSVDDLHHRNDLYLRVAALQPDDVYAVGDYWVEVDYRLPSVRAGDPVPGPYDSGPDALFAGFGLVDNEDGQNETPTSADSWIANDYAAEQRYEISASMNSALDVDVYKITSPATAADRLLVNVVGIGLDAPALRLRVVDADGMAVGTSGFVRANGTMTVEVTAPVALQDYYVRVSVDPGSTVGVGNYVAVAEFEVAATQMNDVAKGHATGERDVYLRWTAHKSRLFRFDLAASSGGSSQSIRLTIYDAHTREVRAIAIAQSGTTRSLLAWLQQGEYILKFQAVAVGDAAVLGADYRLLADGISDDQDEDPYDPADDPNYEPYDTEYPPYDYNPVDPYYDYPYDHNYDLEFYYYDPYYYEPCPYADYGYT